MSERSSRLSALIVVALAFFTDTLLYYLLVPLLPDYARAYGLNQMQVGVLFGAYAVALLGGTYPLGRLADRKGRRRIMVWGLVGLGATTLLFTFAHSYPLLVLARFLQGLSATATWTSGLAMVADHFPADQRGRAMGTVFAFANLGVIVGPPLAGWLGTRYGPRAPFVVAAGLALLDAVARVTLLRDRNGGKARLELGWGELLRDRKVVVFAGAVALGAGLWAILESTLPLHFDNHLGMNRTTIGLCFAGAALAHAFTSPLTGWLSDKMGRRRILVAGLVLTALLIPVTALVRSPWAIMGVMGALGMTDAFIMSPASPALAEAVEQKGSDSFGSVFGILNQAYAVGMMVGPLAGSAAVWCLGIRSTMLLVGLGFGSYLLVVRWGSRQEA